MLVLGASASVAVTVAGCALVMVVMAGWMVASTVEGGQAVAVTGHGVAQLAGDDHRDTPRHRHVAVDRPLRDADTRRGRSG
jgi:hypothetical protein